jgi:hypothetical protein
MTVVEEIKMTSLFGETAKKFIKILESGAEIKYRQRSVEGRTVLDIVVEAQKK